MREFVAIIWMPCENASQDHLDQSDCIVTISGVPALNR
jgi:hypothetical protein